jgi:hypothetical protein
MITRETLRSGRGSVMIRWALVGLLLFAVYHLARDVLTTFFYVQSAAVDIGHRSHEWCGGVCDYVTMPLEVFNIVASAVVLRRRRIGVLGIVNLLTIPLWLLAWFGP